MALGCRAGKSRGHKLRNPPRIIHEADTGLAGVAAHYAPGRRRYGGSGDGRDKDVHGSQSALGTPLVPLLGTPLVPLFKPP
jgi:hypothetical protein